MKQVPIFAIIIMLLTFGAAATQAQITPIGWGMSPKDVVEQLWNMATQGELLTPNGWSTASKFFLRPSQFPGDKLVRVMSNYWGPPGQLSAKGNADRVDFMVGYQDAGQIDSKLRYTPPKDTGAVKSGMVYHLVLTPT